MAILVHVASVWIPFISESKEAVEPYPEIVKETKLGLQQCARKLAQHLNRGSLLQQEQKRRGYIDRQIELGGREDRARRQRSLGVAGIALPQCTLLELAVRRSSARRTYEAFGPAPGEKRRAAFFFGSVKPNSTSDEPR